jgi:hypothetical protein
MKRIILIIAITMLAGTRVSAQLDLAWVRSYGNNYTFGHKLAIDTLGNVYALGGIESPYEDPSEGILAAYSSNGDTLWTRVFNQFYFQNLIAIDLALNNSGDLYIIGSSQINDLPRYYLMKLSTQGDSLWARDYRGPVEHSATPSAVTVDSLGNAYVSGTSDGPCWATLKYDRDGNRLWTALYTGYPDLTPSSVDEIALDSEGNVIVAGLAWDRFNDYHVKAVIIKYNNSGNRLWTATIDSVDRLNHSQIAIDNSNNIFISVLSSRADTLSCGPLIAKILPDGETDWSRIYWPGRSFESLRYNVAVDSSGFAYLAGPLCVAPDDTDYYDIVLIKYTTDGDTVWTGIYDSGRVDNQYDMTIGPSGAVYILGRTFRNHQITLVKYTTDGDLGWAEIFAGDSLSYDYARALAVDKFENIFVTGRLGNRFATMKFVQTGSNIEDGQTPLPENSLLSSAYPNPFNSQTTIQYSLPAQADVTIDIFDILGRKIATIAEVIKPVGKHQAIWDAAGQSSGIYFYRITAGDIIEAKRMLLVR